MEKVTIIVPVYNVENYINECVDSLINQKYKEIEILLIDDGSTDNSGKICDAYAKNDNVKVYHKKNGGLSDARNYGLKKATGKYICFVDSDDYVKDDYVESMLKNIKKYNTNISSCGMCRLHDNGKYEEYNFQNVRTLYTGDDAQIFLNVLGYYNVSACNKLFKKELFDDIEFPYGKKSEDCFIMYKLIEKSGSIYYDSDSKYIYRQRTGSISKNSKANTDSILAAKEVYNYFKNNNNVKKFAAQMLAFTIIGVYNYELCRGVSKKELKEYYYDYKKIRLDISKEYLSNSRKIQLLLFDKSLFLYNIIFKLFDLVRKLKKK